MRAPLSLLALLFALNFPVTSASCDSKNCTSCTATSGCHWCVATSSCGTSSCNAADTITDSFNCPISPNPNFAYTDDFGRKKVLPIVGASYAKKPDDCLKNQLPGAYAYGTIEVLCDASNQNDTCYVFTAVSPNDKAIIVGFRGTQGNWETVEEVLAVLKGLQDFQGLGQVFQYFANAFNLLWSSGLEQQLHTLKFNFPDYELWVAGHSLGGSLASLCSALVVKTQLWSASKVKMVTMGQPRTGDETYARNHDQLLNYSYRLIHRHDPVAHLPPKLGSDPVFHHRFEVWYDNSMTTVDGFVVCQRADDSTCSNAQLNVDFDDHTHYFNMSQSDWGAQGCPTLA